MTATTIIDASTAAAVAAATDQEAQLGDDLNAPFTTAGSVVLNYYSAADVLLATVTHPSFVLITSTTPRELRVTGRGTESYRVTGPTAASYVVARAGLTDIFRAPVSLAASIGASTGQVSLLPQTGAAGLVVTATGSLPTGGFTAALTITTPVRYTMCQRTPTTGDIAITGTHSGIESGGIEASFNGGAYQTIVASPTGGTFSGTLTAQAVGQGTLTVRCVNSQSSTATKADIGVGDVYVVIGDSNHSGRGVTTAVQPTGSPFTAIEYAADGAWKPLQEAVASSSGAFDDPTGSVYGAGSTDARGSYFGALSTHIINTGNVPVAFVPCARGSTTIDQWGDTSHGTDTAYLYGVALSTIRDIGYTHKAALCLLGTNTEAGNEAATTTLYDGLVNAWFAATGAPMVLYYAYGATTANNNAVTSVLGSNSHAKTGPSFATAWSGGVHYTTPAETQEAADRAWAALQALFY